MTDATAAARRNWWTLGLWVAQVVLALLFGMAGFIKLMTPIDALALQMAWVEGAPAALVWFIAIAEIAGALGVILPAATRIMPFLTPLAALGFVVIQVLAIGVHIVRGEPAILPMNFMLLAVAAFVVWGRWRKAPIAPRA